MGSVTRSRNLVATDALSRSTVLGTVVWILVVVRCSTLVVCIERAACSTTLLVSTSLLTSDLATLTKKGAVNSRLVNNPRES